MKRKSWFVVTALLCIFAFGLSKNACAAEQPTWRGYLGFQAPVFFEPGRAVDRPMQVIGGLTLEDLVLNLTFKVDVQHSLRGDVDLDSESKVRAAVELPLGQGWTAFVGWQRRYRVEQDQCFAGVRLDFGSR